MQINKIQSPNFGKCEICKSAYKAFETVPANSLSEMFQKVASLQDTKRWDLYIMGYGKQFVPYFRDKEAAIDKSFLENFHAFEKQDNIVRVLANNSRYTIYHLPFASSQRADEVYKIFKQPEPETNMDIFRRAVETTKLLEESNNYVNELKENEDKKLINKIRSFLGLKK